VWGPLIGNDSDPSDFSLLSCLASFLPSKQDEKDIIALRGLMTELTRVRDEVFEEYQWFSDSLQRKKLLGDAANGSENEIDSYLAYLRKKRLLYLFVKDLSGGVCAEVLSSKTQRDSMAMTTATTRVSAQTKFFGWVFVGLLNFGMLFYVYLFAMQQTQSRQSAWFVSFVIWLVFEIFISSTGLVFLVHLMIPLFIFAEMTKIKQKVLKDLMLFRENCLKKKKKQRNLTKAKAMATAMTPSSAPSPEAGGETEKEAGKDIEFNAAKYLFTSWRVASLFPEMDESELILQFRTTWPKKRFGTEEATNQLSSDYDQTVVTTAVSRVLLYFLTSLLQFHEVIQDAILQIVCNSGWGYVGLMLIRLSTIHPLLPALPVFALLLCIHFAFRSAKSHRIVKNLGEILPLDQTKAGDEDEEELEEGQLGVNPLSRHLPSRDIPLNFPQAATALIISPPLPNVLNAPSSSASSSSSSSSSAELWSFPSVSIEEESEPSFGDISCFFVPQCDYSSSSSSSRDPSSSNSGSTEADFHIVVRQVNSSDLSDATP
jgi:hypothetical protein